MNKAISYLTTGAAVFGLAAFGASAFRASGAKAGHATAIVTADTDPAQAVGGTVSASGAGPIVAELGVGPLYLTDTAGGGNPNPAYVSVVPSDSVCGTSNGATLAGAGAHGLHFFIGANQKLCAWTDTGGWSGSLTMTWAGFRPY